MESQLFHRSSGGRFLVRAGIVFVVLGAAAVFWMERQRGLLQEGDRLPTILEGQVTTRLPGVKVDRLNISLSRGAAPLAYVQSVQTDQSGRFSFKGPFSDTVRIILGANNKACVWRPIGPIAVPRKEPLVIELIEGAAVGGRVVRDGRPLANVVLRLREVEPNPYSVRPGAEAMTDDQGRFRFVHLSENTDYYAFTPLDALTERATMSPRRLQTGGDATTLDLGDIAVGKGLTLKGCVVLSDGKSLAPTTVVAVQCLVSGSAMRRQPDSRGHFRFKGLPEGPMTVYFEYFSSTPFPPKDPLAGYRLSPKNTSLDRRTGTQLLGTIDRDISGLTILVEPGERALPTTDAPPADYAKVWRERLEEARTRPLAGMPPEPARTP